jgi:hypothetical protein
MEQNILELTFDNASFSTSQKQVLKGLDEVIKAAEKIEKTKISIGADASFKQLNAQIAAQTKQIQALQAANVKYIKSQEALTKADTAVIVQMQQEEKLLQEQIKTRKAATAEKDKSARASAAEQKQIDQLSNEYLQLNKAHQDAILRYRNLAIVKGEDNAATLEALKNANEMGAVLKRLDANLNIHNRNVGNYKSAFDGLGFSFTQVARELPSLTISFQQFALAISNNLPFVFDEVAKARTEIAQLSAEGKETPNLLTRIAKGLFSWQVLLSVGIALFTAFAKPITDFVTGLFNTNAAQEKAEKSAISLNQAYLELLKTQGELSALFGDKKSNRLLVLELELEKARQLNANTEKILEIEERLSKTRFLDAQKASDIYNQNIALIEQEIRTKQSAYNDLLLMAANDPENKDLTRKKEVLKTELDLLKERYRVGLDLQKEYTDAYLYREQVANQKTAYFAEERRKLDKFNAIQRAEISRDAAERLLQDEATTQNARIQAIKQSAQAEKNIAIANYNDVKNNTQSSKNDIIIAEKTKDEAIRQINLNSKEEIYKVNEDYRKRNLAAQKSALEAELSLDDLYNQMILEAELSSMKQQLEAQQRGVDNQITLENERYKQEKDRKGLTNEELESIEEIHQAKLTSIAAKATVDRLRLVTELQLKASANYAKDINTQEIEAFTQEINRLESQFDQKLITAKQYNEQLKTLERNYADQGLQSQLEALTKQKEILIRGKKDTTDINNQIAAVENIIAKKRVEKRKATTEELEALDKQVLNASIDLARETLNLFEAIATSQYEQEKNRLQELIDLSEERYNKEAENIRNSTLNEEQKANRLKILENEQQTRRRQYEREIREQNIKKAKAERVFQVFQIAGNTAIGITSALAQFPPNPILAGIIGAIGAVQIAKVLATPIPSYAKGTDNHPGGFARYGEAGPERVDEPGKHSYIVDQETIGYLPKGTKVTPLNPDDVNAAMSGGAQRMQEAVSNPSYFYDSGWDIAKWQMKNTEKLMNKIAKRPIRNTVLIKEGLNVNKVFGRA